MSTPQVERFATNVLVIGAGAAGLRASIELAERGTQVLCVGKRRRDDAHTVLAAGGINAVLATTDPEDSIEQHAADTLRESYWLADPRAVEILARESPRAIRELVDWGAEFAREESGELIQRFFGAHRYRRTCYAGDYTGREIQGTLVREAQRRRIDFHDNLYITRLLVQDGQVFGAYGFDVDDGRRYVIFADAVVLAAGGHTRIFRRSSSRRDENTGDAMRLALDAGCRLQDMELVQFHPTGMVWPEDWAGMLVTEAVRGEGGVLRNADGRRYMEDYDPERMELSTRDRVALANYLEIHHGRGGEYGGVYLDVSHLGREEVLERLPRMYRQFVDAAMVDITRQPMEVAPTAHYSMGGVRVDPDGHETDVAGLFAVGECAAGVHGANRLGGNSLAETVVFGRIVGERAAEFSAGLEAQIRARHPLTEADEELSELLGRRGEDFPRPIQRGVRDVMWEHAGVVRSEEGLRTGLARLDEIERQAEAMEVRPDIAGFDDVAHGFDLLAMIVSARATLVSALERRETRGAHNREDFPDGDPAQRANVLYDARGEVSWQPVADAPAEVVALAGEGTTLEAAGKLLE